MPTVVQFRRGTTAQNNSFTGAAGELSVDTTLGTIRVHNGIAGGNTLASIDAVQTLSNKTLSAPTITGTLSSTGFINTTANISAAVAAFGSMTNTGTSTVAVLNSTGNILATGGILSSLTVNGNVTVTTAYVMPSANAASSLGTSATRWNFIYGVNGNFLSVNANYADLAENYTSDSDYSPGTVLVFGGEAEVTQSHSSHDTRIAGVVSTNPAYLMNGAEPGVPVALQGRVPCRVLGPVSKGDRVVSSHIAGVAQALDPQQYQPGCIIGKALQAIDSTDINTIEVVVGRL
jgi:hypothetical protein